MTKIITVFTISLIVAMGGGCVGTSGSAKSTPFVRISNLESSTDIELSSILKEINGSMQKFMNRVPLKDYSFDYVTNTGFRFPVRRYEIGNRYLFLYIDSDKELILRAHFVNIPNSYSDAESEVPKVNDRQVGPIEKKK